MTEPSGSKSILVLEDEFLIALDFAGILEDLGYNVIGPLKSVAQTLSVIEKAMPDGALLDENVNGTPATPVAEALNDHDVPFAIVSGHARSPFGAAALDAAPRLQKPVTAEQIDRIVRKF